MMYYTTQTVQLWSVHFPWILTETWPSHDNITFPTSISGGNCIFFHIQHPTYPIITCSVHPYYCHPLGFYFFQSFIGGFDMTRMLLSINCTFILSDFNVHEENPVNILYLHVLASSQKFPTTFQCHSFSWLPSYLVIN